MGRQTLTATLTASWKLDAFVVSTVWNQQGTHLAFVTSLGEILVLGTKSTPETRLLCLQCYQSMVAAPLGPQNFIVSADEGKLFRVTPSGEVTLLHHHPGVCIDSIASGNHGYVAVGVGRSIMLIDDDGTHIGMTDQHESTVSQVMFSRDGSRIFAAHYGGVTVWKKDELRSANRRLRYAGSHLTVCVSQDNKFAATCTQEKEVHAWRLKEDRDMRMSGYYAKPKSMSWSADGHWLVTSGGDAATAWSFAGKGPEGKAPRLLGPIGDSLVSVVSCHPSERIAAIGYEDGAVVLASLGQESYEVPVVSDGGAAVSALEWSPSGSQLKIGARDGTASLAAITMKINSF